MGRFVMKIREQTREIFGLISRECREKCFGAKTKYGPCRRHAQTVPPNERPRATRRFVSGPDRSRA